MPPLTAQDALSAVQRGAAWRWLDLPVALADVASEPWVVALIALALSAWLEPEVKGVVKSFLPLALALLAAGGLAIAARALGAVPRPLGEGGPGVAPLLRQAFPSGKVAAVTAFAVYSLLAYGRRARGAAVLAAAVAVARAASGAHWLAELAGGAAAGGVLGAGAYLGALRSWPRGHLSRLRAARRRRRGGEDAIADPPSA